MGGGTGSGQAGPDDFEGKPVVEGKVELTQKRPWKKLRQGRPKKMAAPSAKTDQAEPKKKKMPWSPAFKSGFWKTLRYLIAWAIVTFVSFNYIFTSETASVSGRFWFTAVISAGVVGVAFVLIKSLREKKKS